LSDWEGIREKYVDEQEETFETNPDSAIRILQHENKTFLSYAFGLQDTSKAQIFAAKYCADTAGVVISSVGTWFVGNSLSEGTIKVEVRAGGKSIEQAVPLAAGALNFAISPEEKNGAMYYIPLSKQASIYPNEDFYVIITYPAGQEKPQGCAMNSKVSSVSGRYLVKSEDGWQDLQQMSGFSKCAWLTEVLETKHENIAWMRLLSAHSGNIPAGRTSTVHIRFEGRSQLKGEKNCEIVVAVGDSCLTDVIIPVKLHVNEAPFFMQSPNSIYVPENSTKQYEIKLYDNEGDRYEVQPVGGARVLTHDLTGSKLRLTVSPRTGDAGIYHVRYRITDEHGESRDLEIPVYITAMEQLYDPEGLVCSFMEDSLIYNIRDLFNYVNGDEFSFLVSAEDGSIVKLKQKDGGTIIFYPDGLGTTVLNFILTDSYGNEFLRSIPFTVGLCENASPVIVQKWNSVLLVNNASNRYSSEGYQWFRNREAIPNATGQYYTAGEETGEMLDFTASYHVRLVTLSGDTVYTCPMRPVLKNDPTAKSFPNPVSGGEMLTVETGFAETAETTYFQLTDLLGRVVQTGSFNGVSGTFRIAEINSGYYRLVTGNKKERKSFGIYIK
jgi:hypothetical protein